MVNSHLKRLSGVLLLIPALFFALPGCSWNEEPDELDIQDVTLGTGTEAQVGDSVYVRYTGKLDGASGTVFEQFQNPRGYILLSGRMTDGLALGILGMKVGGKRTVYAPSDYGYGPVGLGQAPNYTVPPNTPLFYEIELTGVKVRIGIEDVLTGTGLTAKVGDDITVKYVGKIAATGAVFEDRRDNAVTFPLTNNLILGWVRGIPGMKVGGKRILRIPADMAYGERGSSNGTIPPNTDLIFEIELVGLRS